MSSKWNIPSLAPLNLEDRIVLIHVIDRLFEHAQIPQSNHVLIKGHGLVLISVRRRVFAKVVHKLGVDRSDRFGFDFGVEYFQRLAIQTGQKDIRIERIPIERIARLRRARLVIGSNDFLGFQIAELRVDFE